MFLINIDGRVRAAATATLLAMCLLLGACAEKMNREDFATLLRNKTGPEVLKNTGKPTSVDESKGDRHVWTYTARTFDVQNQNKVDAKAIVIFSPSAEGKMVVSEVKFE